MKNNSTNKKSRNFKAKSKISNLKFEKDKYSEIFNLKYQLGIIKGKKVLIKESENEGINEEEDNILININVKKIPKNIDEFNPNNIDKLNYINYKETKISDRIKKLKETLNNREERHEEFQHTLQKKKNEIKNMNDNISKKREIRSKVAKLVNSNSYFVCQDFLFKTVK